jgi:hypothetical protein
MPFQYVLANLLAENRDAVGVLFLDDSGEAVDVAAADLDHGKLRLLGAYVGIYLRRVGRFLEPEIYGNLEAFELENADLYLHGVPLSDGYFLVLVQRSPTLTARARRSILRARDQLKATLFEHPRAVSETHPT